MAASSHSEVKREHNQKTCEKGKQNGGGAPAGDEGKPAEMPTVHSYIFLSMSLSLSENLKKKKDIKEKLLCQPPEISSGNLEIIYLLWVISYL